MTKCISVISKCGDKKNLLRPRKFIQNESSLIELLKMTRNWSDYCNWTLRADTTRL